MKILTFSGYYPPHVGGIEQTARDCVNALKEGNEQRVICFNHEKGNRTEEVDGVTVVRAGCFAKVASQQLSFGFKKLLKREFREFRPDVVIFHYPNPFAAHYLLKCLKKYPACKLVLYWHLDITKQKILGKFFKGQTKRLLRRAAKIVATSPNYIEGSPWLSGHREKCTVIPSCINDKRITITEDVCKRAEEIKAGEKGRLILFALGRHVGYKGFGHLIGAGRLLPDEYRVFIGGEGPETPALKNMAAGDGKIVFLGRLGDDAVKAYMQACDIFCFPSVTKNEAFGLALAEAMSFGKPAVTFTIEGSGVNFVSLNGVTGIEVPNGDDRAYAEAIERLGKDEELRATYGDAARERALALCSQSVYSEKIRALMDGIGQ